MGVHKEDQKQEVSHRDGDEQEGRGDGNPEDRDSQEQESSQKDGEERKDVHKEHRERMRQRFVQTGLESFAEHEALELLLFFSISRRDTNKLAHSLIERFGSLSGVFSATSQELMQVKGVGQKSAVLVSLVSQIYRKYRLMETEVILNSSEKIGEYLLQRFDGARNEKVYLLCLNRRCKVLACPCVRDGGLCGADMDVREIVKHAILASAVSVVLAHNHPSGLPLPSPSDYAATDQIREALKTVGISLMDHIIVSERDYVSLRESGYL